MFQCSKENTETPDRRRNGPVDFSPCSPQPTTIHTIAYKVHGAELFIMFVVYRQLSFGSRYWAAMRRQDVRHLQFTKMRPLSDWLSTERLKFSFALHDRTNSDSLNMRAFSLSVRPRMPPRQPPLLAIGNEFGPAFRVLTQMSPIRQPA